MSIRQNPDRDHPWLVVPPQHRGTPWAVSSEIVVRDMERYKGNITLNTDHLLVIENGVGQAYIFIHMDLLK